MIFWISLFDKNTKLIYNFYYCRLTLQSKTDEISIENEELKIDTKWPFTFSGIKIPARGSEWIHAEVFDSYC